VIKRATGKKRRTKTGVWKAIREPQTANRRIPQKEIERTVTKAVAAVRRKRRILEARDRAGYLRQPQTPDEFLPWEEAALWPEE